MLSVGRSGVYALLFCRLFSRISVAANASANINSECSLLKRVHGARTHIHAEHDAMHSIIQLLLFVVVMLFIMLSQHVWANGIMKRCNSYETRTGVRVHSFIPAHTHCLSHFLSHLFPLASSSLSSSSQSLLLFSCVLTQVRRIKFRMYDVKSVLRAIGTCNGTRVVQM